MSNPNNVVYGIWFDDERRWAVDPKFSTEMHPYLYSTEHRGVALVQARMWRKTFGAPCFAAMILPDGKHKLEEFDGD